MKAIRFKKMALAPALGILLGLALAVAWPVGVPTARAAPCNLTYNIDTLIGTTTWGLADSPVCVNATWVTVVDNATLTVDPGVVVKFRDAGSYLYVQGTLRAMGTRDDKIYFTSLKDDTVGGDTNGDGAATSPAAGDWAGLYLYGSGDYEGIGDLDWVEVRYGGYLGRANLWGYYSDALTVANSLFTSSLNDGARVERGGSVTFANSLFARNQARGLLVSFGPVTLHSSDVVSNTWGGIYLQNADGSIIRNTLVISNLRGVQLAGPAPTFENNDVWGNVIDYDGPADQTGLNGNISADPLFVNFAAGDYHLSAGSPAIDAGTATGAPATDIDGEARPQGLGYDMGFDEWKTRPTAVGLAAFGAASSGPEPWALAALAGGLLAAAWGGLELRHRRGRRKGDPSW